MLHRGHGILPYFFLAGFSRLGAVNSGEVRESIAAVRTAALHKKPSSPAKAGDPVITGVSVYWFPAFAGMTPDYVENAVRNVTAHAGARKLSSLRVV
jgi:hypothetical protein